MSVNYTGEVIVVTINTTLVFISLLVLVYINLHHAYVPFKCKNIPLLNILYLCTFIWYLADIFTYQTALVHLNRPLCIAMLSWLRFSFGIYSVILCHIFRNYQYLCIFHWRQPAVGRHLWYPLAGCLVIPLGYGITATVLPVQEGIEFRPESVPAECIAHKHVYFLAVAFLVFLMLVWLISILVMNRITMCFNEYREAILVFAFTTLMILLQIIIRWVPSVDHNGFTYYTIVSVSDTMVGQFSLYMLILKPLYHCLGDREGYLRYFLRKLQIEQLRMEYELANGEELVWLTESSRSSKESSARDKLLTMRDLVRVAYDERILV